jgi:2-(1,2-epoxy-1,2-dihydrophenyl)acetyl-CoA isomerase
MSNEQLLVERRDGVLYLTMNQPDKLNALNPHEMGAILRELGRAGDDPEVGAVVLTGAGRGFCAGWDVGRMQDREGGAEKAGARRRTIEQQIAQVRRWEEASLLLHEMPKVTIAAVSGVAVGAGLCLALACDLRIASEAARFGTAFARIGLCGDFGGSYLLTWLVGPAKARELYLLADMIDANEALRIGMVNRVVPAASLMAEAHALAGRIAAGPRVAYSHMKANLNLAMHSDLRTILDREAAAQILAHQTEDHCEAVKAFLEKRKPAFQGR